MNDTLHPEDDLVAMERSCWLTFIDPAQKMMLQQLLDRQEAADNRAFLQEFAPDFLMEEESPIHWEDTPYDPEEEWDELPEGDDLENIS